MVSFKYFNSNSNPLPNPTCRHGQNLLKRLTLQAAHYQTVKEVCAGQKSVSSMVRCWGASNKKLFSHFDGDPFQMCTCPPLYSFRPQNVLCQQWIGLIQIRWIQRQFFLSKIGNDCIVYDDVASCEGNQHYQIATAVDVEQEVKGRWIHCHAIMQVL